MATNIAQLQSAGIGPSHVLLGLAVSCQPRLHRLRLPPTAQAVDLLHDLQLFHGDQAHAGLER